ncbi:hypothetical protein [Wolbachia endosymbiont of Psylliodes chrysocephala]|uniref:hypothetical protein n=1 Tax=Wolbachia endosymbiont of Psylliodes chrysocephala TaxID=2883236 RepID=UPI0020A19AFA|nr:hypothetical protein [Wolbachia endosymbiont of Psylliodes chrysocephala]
MLDNLFDNRDSIWDLILLYDGVILIPSPVIPVPRHWDPGCSQANYSTSQSK